MIQGFSGSLCGRHPMSVERMKESNQPCFDYRIDGSWRISPPHLQGEFRAYLSKLGYHSLQLTPERLKPLIEAFMIERNYNKTDETEHILRHPDNS